jgi:hypothetical protein
MVNKTIGIDPDKLKELSADIPVMTMEEAEAHTQFIQQGVDQIIKAHKEMK